MNPAGQALYSFATFRPVNDYPLVPVLGLPTAIRPGLVDPAGFLASVGLLASNWIALTHSQKAALVTRSGRVPASGVESFIAAVDAFALQPLYAAPYGFGFGLSPVTVFNPFFVRSFGDRANLATTPRSNANPNKAGFVRPAGQTAAVGISFSGVFSFALGAVVGVVATKNHWFGL